MFFATGKENGKEEEEDEGEKGIFADPERKINTSLRLPGRAREDEQRRSAANEGGASLTQLAPVEGGAWRHHAHLPIFI